MSFRRRLILGSTAAIALVVALVMPLLYFGSRNELRAGVDHALAARAAAVASTVSQLRLPPPPSALPSGSLVPAPRLGEAGGYIQFISKSGTVRNQPGASTVPIDAGDRAVARGEASARYRDITLDGRHLRVLTSPLGTNGAVQITRSLEEVDSVLSRFRLIFGIGAGVALVLATALGAFVARTRPDTDPEAQRRRHPRVTHRRSHRPPRGHG